jgi:hypothetical protein
MAQLYARVLTSYARVSKADGLQSLDLQHDALHAAGVETDRTISMTIAHLAVVTTARASPPASNRCAPAMS